MSKDCTRFVSSSEEKEEGWPFYYAKSESDERR